MKRFINYLNESAQEKKYAFKIKVAGALPDNCEDCMESALQKFQVSKFSKGKTTPIQATLLDFPTITNAEMTMFEVELDYPATSHVITELLANATGIAKNAIVVRTPLEEANWAIENENTHDDGDKKALLSQDYEKENNQKLVGEKYISSFLKDLAKTRKDSQPEQYKGVNDALLAKKPAKEKENAMPAPGPARSVFASK